MHIKTNIEHNMIQIVILAICPLLMVVSTINQAIFFIVAVAVCFASSSFVCGLFNRYFSKNIKIFVTAILSSFIIAIVDYLLKSEPKFGLESNDDCFYAVLSTVCLCLDVFCVDTKSIINLHMIKTAITTGVFAGILLLFGIIVEVLGTGSLFDAQVIASGGNEFFTSITFKLILLGILAIVADYVYRLNQEKINEKKIAYEKYVRKIRDEKLFQYDELRRKKLLTSKIEMNHVKEDFVEIINQKVAENESIEKDINESLKKSQPKPSEKKNDNKKQKHKKSKNRINAKEQEKEKKSKNDEEKVDNPKDKPNKKEKRRGKARVERVFTSNTNPDGDDKKN